MNTNEKGRKLEKLCEDELKKNGYITWRVARHMYQNMDFMGHFDVVGFNKGLVRKYIQVKSEGCSTRKEFRKIMDFKIQYGFPGESYELWIYIPKQKKFRILSV